MYTGDFKNCLSLRHILLLLSSLSCTLNFNPVQQQFFFFPSSVATNVHRQWKITSIPKEQFFFPRKLRLESPHPEPRKDTLKFSTDLPVLHVYVAAHLDFTSPLPRSNAPPRPRSPALNSSAQPNLAFLTKPDQHRSQARSVLHITS